MIQIVNFNWLSKEASEAEVHLSDGEFRLTCFSHPFKIEKVENRSFRLYALNTQHIYKVENERKFFIEKGEDPYNYIIIGKVLDNLKGFLKIGEFIIELDTPIPSDVDTNSYISFYCDRIDIL